MYRDWGYYEVLYSSEYYRVKRLVINPYSHLSMQRHKFRSETLLVVEGELTVSTLQAYNESLLLKRLSKGEVFQVLPNQWHSYGNPGPEPCVLIETWIGSKMSEEDIERHSLNNSLLKG